jgi:hypothetical protein
MRFIKWMAFQIVIKHQESDILQLFRNYGKLIYTNLVAETSAALPKWQPFARKRHLSKPGCNGVYCGAKTTNLRYRCGT